MPSDVLALCSFLLWLAACAGVLIYGGYQAFRLAVLLASALLDIEEDHRG